jgi:hypothetical protein
MKNLQNAGFGSRAWQQRAPGSRVHADFAGVVSSCKSASRALLCRLDVAFRGTECCGSGGRHRRLARFGRRTLFGRYEPAASVVSAARNAPRVRRRSGRGAPATSALTVSANQATARDQSACDREDRCAAIAVTVRIASAAASGARGVRLDGEHRADQRADEHRGDGEQATAESGALDRLVNPGWRQVG